MRAAFTAVLVAGLVGCSGSKKPDDSPPAPSIPSTLTPPPSTVPPPTPPGAPKDGGKGAPEKKQPAEKKEPPKSAPPVVEEADFTKLFTDYEANEVAADARYKGKRGQTLAPVAKIGRTPGGVAYIGVQAVAGAEPSVFYYFDKEYEADLADVKVGQTYTVEGVCRGKTRDGIRRGGLKGFDWRIEFDHCRVAGATPPKK